MAFRTELTYSEIQFILDLKYIATSTKGHTLPPGINKICDLNSMLKLLLPTEGKVKVTFDVLRLRSNLVTDKTESLLESLSSAQF